MLDAVTDETAPRIVASKTWMKSPEVEGWRRNYGVSSGRFSVLNSDLTRPSLSNSDSSVVAARIRQFQDAATFEPQSSRFENAPRVMTQAAGYNTTFGRGRRAELDFASPGGRASRDGTEGLRGDNRPPVAMPSSQLDAERLYGRPRTELGARPHTSFGDYRNELSSAKLRLRPTVPESIGAPSESTNGVSTQGGERRSKRSEVFAELESLIDDAIEETSAAPPGKMTAPESPRTLKRFNTVKSPRPSRIRSLSQTMTPLSDEQYPTNSRNASLSSQRERLLPISPRFQGTNFDDYGLRSPPDPSDVDTSAKFSPRTSLSSGQSSPVKERSAIFERMQSKITPSRQIHKPPISLALPQLLGRHDSSHDSPEETDDPYPKSSRLIQPVRPASAMRSTMVTFGSSGSPPRAGAPVKTERKNSATGNGPQPEQRVQRSATSAIKSRVANLFAAARGERPQDLVQGHEQRQHLEGLANLGPQRVPPLQPPLQDQARLFREPDTYNLEIQPSSTRTLSAMKHSTPLTRGHPSAPDRVPPRESSSAVKEVAMLPSANRQLISQSPNKGSPSTPSTPIRGRTLKRQPHLVMNTSRSIESGVEQQFSLSRSQSRNNGVRVSIELKSSPERERDEAIVVVRARVVE